MGASTFFMVGQELPWQKWMLLCCPKASTGLEHQQVGWWPCIQRLDVALYLGVHTTCVYVVTSVHVGW